MGKPSIARKQRLVYLPAEVDKRLKDEAHRLDKSISELAGDYIRQGLESAQKKEWEMERK